GAGGMGEVYRARDTRLRREVAIKVLPAALASDATALARFEREAQAVASRSHPNIIALYEFGRDGDLSFAALERSTANRCLACLHEAPCRSARLSSTAWRLPAVCQRPT